MKIEIVIPDLILDGVLRSAFDAGIGYWARVESRSTHKHLLLEPAELLLLPTGFVQLGTFEEPHRKCKPLNRATISAALTLMAERYPKHFGALLSEDYDATTGDVLVQLAVFGEIVFG